MPLPNAHPWGTYVLNPVVLGTAGHVDHGKTALVKILTGVDTDSLREEKKRGLSIRAGFAPYRLSSGQQIAFVDVPGHERFVKNMLRGISGIDVAVLVVATDDGIMPQTTEHLDILKLLGIRHGTVVLTKIDLVDRDLIELATEEIQELTHETFLEGARCLPFSSVTLEGKEELECELARICASVLPKNQDGGFCLPIDRAFHIHGFGTVVTGTIASGTIRQRDPVEIYPLGKQDSARFLQVHGKSVTEACAGQRVAINLPQIALGDIRNGMVVGCPGGLRSGQIINAEFHYLASQTKPLRNRTKIRFYTGASETNALMVFMDKEVVNAGETVLVQFRFAEEVTPRPFDRYIVRCLSPVTTIGGGTVLEIETKKCRKFDKVKTDYLKLLVDGTDDRIIETAIKNNRTASFSVDVLSAKTGVSIERTKEIISSLEKNGDVIQLEYQQFFYKSNSVEIRNRILKCVAAFHDKNPLKTGLPKQELRLSHFAYLDEEIFNYVAGELEEEGVLVMSKGAIRLSGFAPRLTRHQKEIKKTIEELAMRKLLLNSSSLVDAIGNEDAIEAQNVISYLTRIGELIFIKKSNLQRGCALQKGVYLHKRALENVQELVRDHVTRHGKISIRDMKTLAGTNASCSGALLDYLDTIQFTLLVGEHRILWKSGKVDMPTTGAHSASIPTFVDRG